MRILYIIAIAASIVFMGEVYYYLDLAWHTRVAYQVPVLPGSHLPVDFYDSYGGRIAAITIEAACFSGAAFLFFLFVCIFGFRRIKIRIMRILSIFFLVISLALLLWDFLMLSAPTRISFDEVGPAFLIWSLLALAFAVIGLILAIRLKRGKTRFGTSRSDLLDS